MTPQIAALLAILAAALILFSFEWVSADVVALGVLLALILFGLVPGERAFAGFGSDTVLVILGLLILTSALRRTGVVDMAGRAILRRTAKPGRLPLLIMVAGGTLSSFISNTATTAFLLPVALGVAGRAKISPSRILLPLAFASILASSVTLVASSTNLVVSGLMTRFDLAAIGMFELTPVGIPILVGGLGYLLLVGRRLIPDRPPSNELMEAFGLRPYLSEILIREASPLVGKSLGQSGLGRDLDLTVLEVIREKSKYLVPRATLKLQPGDVLLVEGERSEILKIKDIAGIDIKADVTLADPDLQAEEARLAEALVPPRSRLIGRTLKGVGFRQRYGLQVLGINRHGGTIRRKISQVRLHMGDLLLLQGPEAALAPLLADQSLRVLGAVRDRRPNLARARWAVAIFAGTLATAASGMLGLTEAVLLGVVLVFLTRCITPEEAYREVEWKALIIIACMLVVGSAMEETGAAKLLADRLIGFVGAAGPTAFLTAFFALTVALTQPMSNQAAAAVVLPIAIQTALALDWNPRTFAMMVAVAASTSYLTPLEPSCLLVYGPGRYRFADFLKVGAPLTVLIYLIAIALVPRVWPLGAGP
jgi:di/tricarboxylate transporter